MVIRELRVDISERVDKLLYKGRCIETKTNIL